jgi:hypothetical protein
MRVKATSLNQNQDCFSFEPGTLKQMLDLARSHGWSQPKVMLGPSDIALSDEEASALASALEKALPEVLEDFGTPKLEYRTTAAIAERASQKNLDPISYSRRNGRQLVEDFIAFLRAGGFKTRRGKMEVYEDGDGGALGWCPICKGNLYGSYSDGVTRYLTCDNCKTRCAFMTGGFCIGPETKREIEDHEDYLDVHPYYPSEREQRWHIRVRLPNSGELPEGLEREKEEILKALELLINKLHSFYGAPEGYYETVQSSQIMPGWSD